MRTVTSREEKCVHSDLERGEVCAQCTDIIPRRSRWLPGGEARKVFQRRGYLNKVSRNEQELIGPTKGQSGQRRGNCACKSLGVCSS